MCDEADWDKAGGLELNHMKSNGRHLVAWIRQVYKQQLARLMCTSVRTWWERKAKQRVQMTTPTRARIAGLYMQHIINHV